MNSHETRNERLDDDDDRLTQRIVVHVTEAERIDYQKCAERSGLSLAQWIRDKLDQAARREGKDA